MPDLGEIIGYALSKADEKGPFLVDTIIKNIQKNTQDKVFVSLLPVDEVRVFDDIEEFITAWEINRALVSMYSLLDSLRENYNRVYVFQMDGFSCEDSAYMVNIKRMINRLLIIKASGLFDDGDAEMANKIKHAQMDYINRSRYVSYDQDLNKWLALEIKWNKILDDQDQIGKENLKMEQVFMEPIPETGRNHFINGKIGSSEELRIQERWVAENDSLLQECDSLIARWRLDDALDLCLNRLLFFLGGDNPEVCTILTITNAPYLSAWGKEIDRILKNGCVWNEYAIQKIYRIIDNRFLPGTIRNSLSNGLFRWWAF